jgi:hypothetical protein
MDDRIVLMCARVDGPLMLPDSLVGRCDVCGWKVQYRPHAPKHRILRCMQCAAELMGTKDEIITTPGMVEEAMAYFRKMRH